MKDTLLEEIKQKAKEIADNLNLQLYSFSYGKVNDSELIEKENSNSDEYELTIEIDNHFHNTMEEIESYANKMNEYLDSLDSQIDDIYSLNVCSPNFVNRKVELNELKYCLDFYLRIETKEQNNILYGTLLKIDEDSFTIKQNNKGRIKNIIVLNSEVKAIYLDIK